MSSALLQADSSHILYPDAVLGHLNDCNVFISRPVDFSFDDGLRPVMQSSLNDAIMAVMYCCHAV